MATEVDICNLALGFLGDRGTVASINPPEGSAQAGYCARFYPIARDSMLQMRDFGFNTRRFNPAATDVTIAQWSKCYAVPNDVLTVIAVLPSDDAALTNGYAAYEALKERSAPFTMETASDGSKIILTNQEEATIICAVRITDTSKFSPLATLALARLLASFLAGPIIKGAAGIQESASQLKIFGSMFAEAATRDANQSCDNSRETYIPATISARM